MIPTPIAATPPLSLSVTQRTAHRERGLAIIFVMITLVGIITLMGITIQITKGMRDGIRNFYTVTQSLALASHSLPWRNAAIGGARWGALLNDVPENFVMGAQPGSGCPSGAVCNSSSWGSLVFDYRESGTANNTTAVDQIHIRLSQSLGFLSGAFALMGNTGLQGLSTTFELGASGEHMLHYVALDRSRSFAGPWPTEANGYSYVQTMQTLFSTAGFNGSSPAVLPGGGGDSYPCWPLGIERMNSITGSSIQENYEKMNLCNQVRRAFPYYLTGRRARPKGGLYDLPPRNVGANTTGTIAGENNIQNFFYNPNLKDWYDDRNDPNFWGTPGGTSGPGRPVLVCGESNNPLNRGRFNQPGIRIFPTAMQWSNGRTTAVLYPTGSNEITDKELCVYPWDTGSWFMTRHYISPSTTIPVPQNEIGEWDLCNSDDPVPAETPSGCPNQTGGFLYNLTDMKIATDKNLENYLIATSDMASETVLSFFSAATWAGPVAPVGNVELVGNAIMFNGNVGQPTQGAHLYGSPIRIQDVAFYALPNGQYLYKNIRMSYGEYRWHRMFEHVDASDFPNLSFENDPLNLGLAAAARRISKLLEPKAHPNFPLPFPGAMISGSLRDAQNNPRYWEHPAGLRGSSSSNPYGNDSNYGLAFLLDYWSNHPQPASFFPITAPMQMPPGGAAMHPFYQNRYDFTPNYYEIVENPLSPDYGKIATPNVLFNNNNAQNISAYAPALLSGSGLTDGGTDTISVLRSMRREAELHAAAYPTSPKILVLVTDGKPNLDNCNQANVSGIYPGLTCAPIPFQTHMNLITTELQAINAIAHTKLILLFVEHPAEANDPQAAQFRNEVLAQGGLVMNINYQTTSEFDDRFRRALDIVATLLRGPLLWVS